MVSVKEAGELSTIRLAIAGVGNCASALLQGIAHYRNADLTEGTGLLNAEIGGYRLGDIEIVDAFDVDRRKVGKPLEEAVFSAPNCTTVFHADLPDSGVSVKMAPILDGIADHFSQYPEEQAILPADMEPCDVVEALVNSRAEVLVLYLPVGSEDATRHFAQACLDANVALVNCIPVFIASDPEWAAKFTSRGLPLVGDDIKSQIGATVIHRVLAQLMGDRGASLKRTYQLNAGGNTDFLNMLDRSRQQSKIISKTRTVQSQLESPLSDYNIHIGPSDYIPWQRDNKICFLRMEWNGFGDIPMDLELRLSVEDSPNSAGMAIEAIRCAKLALDHGIGGPLYEVSGYTMKSPPQQYRESEVAGLMKDWIRQLSG
ncbi:inositol-3-phosphate synthase [Gemmatimonadota bacterium]